MPIQRVQTHPRPTHLLQHLGSYLLERSRNSGDGTSAEGNHDNLQELEGTKVYGLQESNEEVVDAGSGPTKKLLMPECICDFGAAKTAATRAARCVAVVMDAVAQANVATSVVRVPKKSAEIRLTAWR